MSDSDFKKSFMLDNQYISQLITYFNTSEVEEKEAESPYRRYIGQFQDKQIIIFKSGIIIYDDDQELEKLLVEFFEENDINIPDFEKHISEVEEYEASEKIGGWEEMPKGIFLTTQQVEYFVNRMEKIDNCEEMSPEKHELKRYRKDNQILVITTNHIVYTIGGFDGYLQLLEETIENNFPLSEYDLIISHDEQGRWNKIGPVTVSICISSPKDLMKLQLLGVKDINLSRSPDIEEYMQMITNTEISTYTRLLTPDEINSNKFDSVTAYNQYLSDLHDYLLTDIEILRKGKILYHVDHFVFSLNQKSIKKFLPDHTEIIPVKREERESIGLGICSVIAEFENYKWIRKKEEQYNIKLNKNNLPRIKNHSKAMKLLKINLIRSLDNA